VRQELAEENDKRIEVFKAELILREE